MLGFGLQLLAFNKERKVASKEKDFDRLASTHFTSCNLSTLVILKDGWWRLRWLEWIQTQEKSPSIWGYGSVLEFAYNFCEETN